MKQLTILVTTTPGWGHIQACAGSVEMLLKRGHRVIFVIEEGFQGKLAALGYEEFIYDTAKAQEAKGNAGEQFAADLMKSKVFGPETPWEKLVNVIEYLDGPGRLRDVAEMDAGLKKAIDKFSPHLIVYDGNACLPVIHWSGIPWVRVISSAPLFYVVDDSIPPGGSGLPSNGDRSEWPTWNKVRHGWFYGKGLNDMLESLGYKRFPGDIRSPPSESITVYATPEELNYEPVRQKGWFNLEVFNKNEAKEVVQLSKLVPEEFLNDDLGGKFSGKWIYVSMGSLGSIDLSLMKRLVEVLGKTKHKYIFAKGARYAEYDLAANMWGDRFLPQTKIVPLVDLVITHGGNNSVTETFAHGKPMIVLPNFVDQFDNAQRLHETGFGVRLHPYQFTDSEMSSAIDKLLYNDQLKHDLQKASLRIQSTHRHLELALKIEALIGENLK